MAEEMVSVSTSGSSIRNTLKEPSNILLINEILRAHPEFCKQDLAEEICNRL